MALADIRWPSHWHCVFLGREECDLAKLVHLEPSIMDRHPDLIINAAAYTGVDKAEQEKELADRINHVAVGKLGAISAKANIPIIHFSTDYVFDGKLDRPYREEDQPAPLNVYGLSKWKGEQALAASGARHIILRTSWVYSHRGNNFVRKMLSLSDRSELNIVEDQIGSPSSALALARATGQLAEQIIKGQKEAAGIFHLTGAGETNWCDFAKEIFVLAADFGVRSPKIKGITSAEYPTPAIRPKNSRLDCSRIEKMCNIKMPSWRDSLKETIQKIHEGQK